MRTSMHRLGRMRWLAPLVIVATLAIVSNVAMSWACVASGKFGNQESVLTTQQDIAWFLGNRALAEYSDWHILEEATVIRKFGCELRVVSANDNDGRAAPRRAIIVSRLDSGWPFRALRGYKILYMERQSDGSRKTSNREFGYVRIPLSSKWVPVEVVRRGFVTNTLIYATSIGILIICLLALQRLSRRARGKCTNCGYDLRHDYSAGCPECGRCRNA